MKRQGLFGVPVFYMQRNRTGAIPVRFVRLRLLLSRDILLNVLGEGRVQSCDLVDGTGLGVLLIDGDGGVQITGDDRLQVLVLDLLPPLFEAFILADLLAPENQRYAGKGADQHSGGAGEETCHSGCNQKTAKNADNGCQEGIFIPKNHGNTS